MHRPYYSKHSPPPEYLHRCGQPVSLEETTVGYCTRYLFVVDGQAVRTCPRCNGRIRVETLIHPDDRPVRDDATWSDYLDYQQMVRDLGPML